MGQGVNCSQKCEAGCNNQRDGQTKGAQAQPNHADEALLTCWRRFWKARRLLKHHAWWAPFWGPNFGSRNGVPHTKYCDVAPVLGSEIWTPKGGPTNVFFRVVRAFPFNACRCVQAPSSKHSRVPSSTPAFVGQLDGTVAARTREAPLSATGLRSDFRTPFQGPLIDKFCCWTL